MHIICSRFRKTEKADEIFMRFAMVYPADHTLSITNYALIICPFVKNSRISQRDKIYYPIFGSNIN